MTGLGWPPEPGLPPRPDRVGLGWPVPPGTRGEPDSLPRPDEQPDGQPGEDPAGQPDEPADEQPGEPADELGGSARDAADAARAVRDALRDEAAAGPLPSAAAPPEDTPIALAAAAAVRSRAPRAPYPRPTERRVLALANQKGGVGKTTTTVNLAVALAQHGAQVLVVDLDPQGNASTGLGVDHAPGVPDVYDVLVGGRPLAEVVQPAGGVDGCWCAPATLDLAGAEIELVNVVAREWRLQRALQAYCAGAGADLDYVLVDCPPSLGLLTLNAMVAAQELLIPIQCEYYALEGLGQLLRTVEMVRGHLNPALQLSTILLTMYDGRTRLADQVAAEVRAHFADAVLDAVIPRSVRVSEAPGYGQSVLAYDPSSRGAQAYLAAAREFAERGAVATSGQREEQR